MSDQIFQIANRKYKDGDFLSDEELSILVDGYRKTISELWRFGDETALIRGEMIHRRDQLISYQMARQRRK